MDIKKVLFKEIKIPRMFIYAIPPFVIFTIVLLAYWPGILVSDSMVQWNQTQTGVYDDWHPAYNTLYIAMLTKIWNNPGFVLWIQCLWMALALGYLFDRVDKYYDVNKYYLLAMSTIFALIPLNYNFAVTLLKDTMYSTFVIFLTAIVIDIINDEKFFKNKVKCFCLLLVCLVISLFRHNGIIVVGLLGLILIIIYRKQVLPYVVFGGWVVIYLLMTTLGFKLFHIQKNDYANKYAPVSHLMARMLNTDGVEFSEEEMKILEEYTDVEKLKATFDPYNMDYSINCQKIDKIKESGSEYLKFGLKKAFEYPRVTTFHYIHLTSFLYSPMPFKGTGQVGMFIETDLWRYKEQYPNLNENSKIPQILPALKKAERLYQSPKIDKFTMRPAGFMYLTIIMILVLRIIKKDRKIWLIALPTVFNIISLAPAIPVAMTRYVYATMFGFYAITVWFVYEMVKLIINKIKDSKDTKEDEKLQKNEN